MGRRRSSSENGEVRARIGRFFALLGLVGAIMVGALIWQWVTALSSDALALAGGVLIGIVVMLVPLGFIVFGAWLAVQYLEARRPAQPQATQPPVVIVSGGQMYPGLPGAWQPEQQYPPMLADGGNGNGRKAPRSFSVIGDE